MNLTNHAYFNLDGHGAPDVRDLELRVFADYVTAVGEGLIPNGKLIPTSEVPYGFTSPTRVGDVLALTDGNPAMKAAGGVDFNYCAGSDRQTKRIAVLYSPKTGREMTVITDLPGVQVYTGQGLHQTGKGGVRYHAYSGLCLETQRYPTPSTSRFSPASSCGPRKRTTPGPATFSPFADSLSRGRRDPGGVAPPAFEPDRRVQDKTGFSRRNALC